MDNLEEPSNAAEPTICQRLGLSSLIGLACSFLATLFGATGSLIVKFLEDSSPYQIHFARVSIQFIVLLPLISYRKESIITNNWSTNVFLLIRGALGIPAYICLLYGIQFLPLGDAISISYCHVTLVGIFACICLKEPCGIVNIATTFITLCGLVFITQPSFLFGESEDNVSAKNRTIGVILACCSAVLAASTFTLVRKIGKKAHFSVSILYYSWEGIILLTVCMSFTGSLSIPCLHDLLLMLGSAAFAFSSQILTTLALQMERAGPVTLIQTSQIIIAFAFQALFFDAAVSTYSVVGGGLILLSSVILVAQKMRLDALARRKGS